MPTERAKMCRSNTARTAGVRDSKNAVEGDFNVHVSLKQANGRVLHSRFVRWPSVRFALQLPPLRSEVVKQCERQFSSLSSCLLGFPYLAYL
jgi:hypothetical protein